MRSVELFRLKSNIYIIRTAIKSVSRHDLMSHFYGICFTAYELFPLLDQGCTLAGVVPRFLRRFFPVLPFTPRLLNTPIKRFASITSYLSPEGGSE